MGHGATRVSPDTPRVFLGCFDFNSVIRTPSEKKKSENTPWKFNSSPLKIYHPKRKGLYSNHHFFRGELLNFEGVNEFSPNIWVFPKIGILPNQIPLFQVPQFSGTPISRIPIALKLSTKLPSWIDAGITPPPTGLGFQ